MSQNLYEADDGPYAGHASNKVLAEEKKMDSLRTGIIIVLGIITVALICAAVAGIILGVRRANSKFEADQKAKKDALKTSPKIEVVEEGEEEEAEE
jgi:hypothetical protein